MNVQEDKIIADLVDGNNVDEVESDEITLSTGVILKANRVSPLLFDKVARKYPEPKVPVTYIKSKDREEENPFDPDYVKAKEEYETKINDIFMRVLLGLGTEPVHIPEDIPDPEDLEWSVEFEELLGLDIPKEGKNRYRIWVELVAASDVKDLRNLMSKVYRKMGVSSEAVETALSNFQNNEGRGENPES